MATDALTEYLVTWSKARHVLAHRLDVSCHSRPRNTVLWFEQTGLHDAEDVR
jgi:hypothetical protein